MRPSTETNAVRSEADISNTRENLPAEADALHWTLFGAGAPAEVKQRYAIALETLPLAAAPQCDLAALSKRNVDLEAMEVALRRNNPFNFLTQRFRVLCYLVEARPDYFHRFVNDRPRFFAGALTLGLMTLRSAYKAIKGKWLVKRYDLG